MNDQQYAKELTRRAKIISSARVSNPEVTDRAHRYRAQKNISSGPKECAWCGSKRGLMVGHKDGNESNDAPGNLAWTCRRCNTLEGLKHKAAGRGRRTKQFNPMELWAAKPKPSVSFAKLQNMKDELEEIHATDAEYRRGGKTIPKFLRARADKLAKAIGYQDRVIGQGVLFNPDSRIVEKPFTRSGVRYGTIWIHSLQPGDRFETEHYGTVEVTGIEQLPDNKRRVEFVASNGKTGNQTMTGTHMIHIRVESAQRKLFNPSNLSEYGEGAGRLRAQFLKAFPSMNEDSVLEVAHRITQDSGTQPRLAHYAEALQYASNGEGNALDGLVETAKELEKPYRGGGPTPAAKRAMVIGRIANPSSVLDVIGPHLTIAPKIYRALPHLSKTEVDAQLWKLHNSGRVILSEHSMPSHGHERDQLIHADGRVWVGASMRNPSKASGPGGKKKAVKGAPNSGAWFQALETRHGRGDGSMTLQQAIDMIHDTPFKTRQKYNSIGTEAHKGRAKARADDMPDWAK